MADPDRNKPHPFHEGPTGRCTYALCGRGADADLHRGFTPVVESVEPGPVSVESRDPEPGVPAMNLLEGPGRRQRRKRVPWEELPIPSRMVIIAATACGLLVVASASVALSAWLLRVAEVIG